MRPKCKRGGAGMRRGGFCRFGLGLVVVAGTSAGHSQTCTTQARMSAAQRTEVGTAAYALAKAVAAADASRVREGSVTPYAGDPNQVAYLVRTTAEQVTGDQLRVSQLYLLDASGRGAGEGTPAEFACALSGTVSETDFSINGLPQGRFAFAMVEAQGAHPWLLPFLLEQQGGAWKMAGFYPHARTAAGHDGVWYWTMARADTKTNKPWLAWLLYGEAAQLLRPASFVSSGNLDRLLGEQRMAAPQGLASGLSAQTPYSLQGPGGTVYQVTSLGTDSSSGEGALNLTMHIQVPGPAPTAEAATERNLAAARALLLAHAELRDSFSQIWVIADAPSGPPFTVERPVSAVLAGAGAS